MSSGMMNGIVASGQVKVVDKVYAYTLLDNGAYRLTGHGIEMVTTPRPDGKLGLKMTTGTLRNVGMRTLKASAGRLIVVS